MANNEEKKVIAEKELGTNKVEKNATAKKTTKKATAKSADNKATDVKAEKNDLKKTATKTAAAKKTKTTKETATVSEAVKQPTVKKTTAKKTTPSKPVEKVDVKEDIEIKDTAITETSVKNGKKILFVTSEAGPFIRSGGLGDVAAALPQALNNLGTDTRVILPLYYDIPNEYRSTMKYIGSVYVTLAWRYQYCGLFSTINNGVTYYFIDNEYYFKRNGLYGHYDDAERYAFFSKAVLESLRLIDFYPDVIHSNDWHSALVPVFLDAFYRGVPEYKNIKTVFTIHNIEFQGKYGANLIKDILGLPEDRRSIVEYASCVNYMKGAIESANAVTTVSPSYSKEIMDRYYAYGLDIILKERAFKLSGIVNGIDTELFNPATDKALFANYDYSTIENKKLNKIGLLKMLDMNLGEDKPLIGMVTRLTEQKGLDLLVAVMDELLQADVQLVILGKGDWKYENRLQELEYRYPNKLKVIINFSTDLANKIYAGSDMFLMPSKFEPCGLSQMIAMKYGTIPIVRETGGLKDTVMPFNPSELSGNGFTFYSYNAYDMLDAIYRAVGTFHNKREWNALVANAMSTDFSWEASAQKYLDLYNSL